MPLGIFEDATWGLGAAQLAAGDVLVLYTDGITEAQDQQDVFFGEDRLLEIAQSRLGHSAQDIHEGLISKVRDFVGDAPQYDDITLMVVAREP